MKQFIFSTHVLAEMARRGITKALVIEIINNPEQVAPGRNQRSIFHSRFTFGEEKPYLVRVIIDETVDPAVIITVYRTSKVHKYWRMS